MIKGSIPFELILNYFQMPQFDLFTFSSQIFWALFFFILLYLSFAYYLIPSISATLKVRNRRLKFQESSSQASSPISANGNSVLDFFIFTKLDQDADQYFHAAETQPSPYLSSDNTLRDSLSCFKLSSDLKNFKSFVFFEACLFQSTNEKSV